jgi:Phage major capsid protein E
METFPDLSKNPAFTLGSLTASINILPNQYGRLINTMPALFPVVGIETRTVMVEERNGLLSILTSKPVGAPGNTSQNPKRKMRTFNVPHFPHEDSIKAASIQGVRAFGSVNQMETITQKLNDKLQEMKNRHLQTLEWLTMGALKGLILDGDGSTLYDLYDEFGITQKVVNFNLNVDATKVSNNCRAVMRWIETHLLGEVKTGIRALCSPEFYDALVEHSSVKAAFQNWSAAQERIGGDLRKGFTFGGITFEEYNASVTDEDANVRRFIAAGDAHFYPEGTTQTFGTSVAPADFIETVNTIGVHVYAKMEMEKFGRGYDIHTQSNPLPICRRPAVLVRATAQ